MSKRAAARSLPTRLARSELVAELVVAALVGEMKDEMCGRCVMCVSSRGGFSAAGRLACVASGREGIFSGETGNVGDEACVGEKPDLEVSAAGGGCIFVVVERRRVFNGEGYAGEAGLAFPIGRMFPSVGLGCPGGEVVKLGSLGGGTKRMVAPSKRPGIWGYATGERPLWGVRGDSITVDSVDRRPSSASMGEVLSKGLEDDVSIVVAEPRESFESFRSGPFQPELLVPFAPSPFGRKLERTASPWE